MSLEMTILSSYLLTPKLRSSSAGGIPHTQRLHGASVSAAMATAMVDSSSQLAALASSSKAGGKKKRLSGVLNAQSVGISSHPHPQSQHTHLPPKPSSSRNSFTKKKNLNTLKLPPLSAQTEASSNNTSSSPALINANRRVTTKDVHGTAEWMEWCANNNVLGGQTTEIEHYEIETCRRYFLTLKISPSDHGVNIKTIAESFYRAEVFPSQSDALQFCQKLVKPGDTIVTFNDLLDCLHDKTFYKRNKMASYMKFVATSDLFDNTLLELSAPTDRRNTVRESRRNSKILNEVRNIPEALLDAQVPQSQNPKLVITRHPSNGAVSSTTVHPVTTKPSLQRKDSSEEYKKYILRRSYTRTESIHPEKIPEEPTKRSEEETNPVQVAPVKTTESKTNLQRQESTSDGSPFKVPQRLKVAAIKIYANNKFLKKIQDPDFFSTKLDKPSDSPAK